MILPIIGNYNFTTTNTIPTKTKRGLSRKAHPSRYFYGYLASWRQRSKPFSMAKSSIWVVPFSWMAMARATLIQRAGRSLGMPMGSSGPSPVTMKKRFH